MESLTNNLLAGAEKAVNNVIFDISGKYSVSLKAIDHLQKINDKYEYQFEKQERFINGMDNEEEDLRKELKILQRQIQD